MIVTMHRSKPALFALSSLLLYVVLLFLLFPHAGGGLGAMVVFPATAFSWFFSTRTALMLNILLVFPVNTLLFNLATAIIEAHRGTIWCESTEEQGCSFCFSLPVIKSRNSRSD